MNREIHIIRPRASRKSPANGTTYLAGPSNMSPRELPFDICQPQYTRSKAPMSNKTVFTLVALQLEIILRGVGESIDGYPYINHEGLV